jgi:hypothetical protein
MWAVENNTPFAAERGWVRDKNGAEVWLVAVRGTFNLLPDGGMEIAEEQDDVRLTPKYSGKPGRSSLVYESDLIHSKPGTDIILHGHAYVPTGNPANQINVGFQVGSITKNLRVSGDRFWTKGIFGMRMTSPQPFVKMPITYERAFGGWDRKSKKTKKHAWEPRNHIGTGFAVEAKHLEGEKLPNVEYPNDLISSWKQRPSPAGFGPVPGHWQPRLKFAGTYDKKWEKERLPLLPDDFDARYNQCAPTDQQVAGYLHGGEWVALQNLTPQGLLKFQLPMVSLNLETHFTRESTTHTAELHTVIIEPDLSRLIMVWHTMLPCHFKVLKLERTTITDGGISMPCCS